MLIAIVIVAVDRRAQCVAHGVRVLLPGGGAAHRIHIFIDANMLQ